MPGPEPEIALGPAGALQAGRAGAEAWAWDREARRPAEPCAAALHWPRSGLCGKSLAVPNRDTVGVRWAQVVGDEELQPLIPFSSRQSSCLRHPKLGLRYRRGDPCLPGVGPLCLCLGLSLCQLFSSILWNKYWGVGLGRRKHVPEKPRFLLYCPP